MRIERNLANLVEKDRAGMRELEAAASLLDGARECAFLVAKELRGNQRRRNRRTVHADECAGRPARVLVDGSCDQFLPGSGFARNQDRQSVGATFDTWQRAVFSAFEDPTISSNMNA